MQPSTYLFTSKRLGFREWKLRDLPDMIAINQNPEVMQFFPKCPTEGETRNFIQRMITSQQQFGFCYFAVELLPTQEFIGFIGLQSQTYEADFTPCVDIGWRLAKKFWGNGYATEGAMRCVQFARETTNLDEIVAVAPVINTSSVAVMKKIGMHEVKTFDHPALKDDKRLRKCVLYQLQLH